ncbi:MAG: hypothetical protein IJ528_10520 [Bacteroidaceae bacterium]|nr:hypothetical protein [Bacteroidaceae bacterium]
MIKKEITIQGRQYPVCFDMQTIINFEEITSQQFFTGVQFNTLKNQIAIVLAAILSADKDTYLTFDTFMGKKDFDTMQQIVKAYVVVAKLMAEFFKLSDVEKKNTHEPSNKEKGKSEKN